MLYQSTGRPLDILEASWVDRRIALIPEVGVTVLRGPGGPAPGWWRPVGLKRNGSAVGECAKRSIFHRLTPMS